jgi:hypothetical protein
LAAVGLAGADGAQAARRLKPAIPSEPVKNCRRVTPRFSATVNPPDARIGDVSGARGAPRST